jgi:hypothetical protein
MAFWTMRRSTRPAAKLTAKICAATRYTGLARAIAKQIRSPAKDELGLHAGLDGQVADLGVKVRKHLGSLNALQLSVISSPRKHPLSEPQT